MTVDLGMSTLPIEDGFDHKVTANMQELSELLSSGKGNEKTTRRRSLDNLMSQSDHPGRRPSPHRMRFNGDGERERRPPGRRPTRHRSGDFSALGLSTLTGHTPRPNRSQHPPPKAASLPNSDPRKAQLSRTTHGVIAGDIPSFLSRSSIEGTEELQETKARLKQDRDALNQDIHLSSHKAPTGRRRRSKAEEGDSDNQGDAIPRETTQTTELSEDGLRRRRTNRSRSGERRRTSRRSTERKPGSVERRRTRESRSAERRPRRDSSLSRQSPSRRRARKATILRKSGNDSNFPNNPLEGGTDSEFSPLQRVSDVEGASNTRALAAGTNHLSFSDDDDRSTTKLSEEVVAGNDQGLTNNDDTSVSDRSVDGNDEQRGNYFTESDGDDDYHAPKPTSIPKRASSDEVRPKPTGIPKRAPSDEVRPKPTSIPRRAASDEVPRFHPEPQKNSDKIRRPRSPSPVSDLTKRPASFNNSRVPFSPPLPKPVYVSKRVHGSGENAHKSNVHRSPSPASPDLHARAPATPTAPRMSDQQIRQQAERLTKTDVSKKAGRKGGVARKKVGHPESQDFPAFSDITAMKSSGDLGDGNGISRDSNGALPGTLTSPETRRPSLLEDFLSSPNRATMQSPNAKDDQAGLQELFENEPADQSKTDSANTQPGAFNELGDSGFMSFDVSQLAAPSIAIPETTLLANKSMDLGKGFGKEKNPHSGFRKRSQTAGTFSEPSKDTHEIRDRGMASTVGALASTTPDGVPQPRKNTRSELPAAQLGTLESLLSQHAHPRRSDLAAPSVVAPSLAPPSVSDHSGGFTATFATSTLRKPSRVDNDPLRKPSLVSLPEDSSVDSALPGHLSKQPEIGLLPQLKTSDILPAPQLGNLEQLLSKHAHQKSSNLAAPSVCDTGSNVTDAFASSLRKPSLVSESSNGDVHRGNVTSTLRRPSVQINIDQGPPIAAEGEMPSSYAMMSVDEDCEIELDDMEASGDGSFSALTDSLTGNPSMFLQLELPGADDSASISSLHVVEHKNR